VESHEIFSYLGLKIQVNQSLERHHNTSQQKLYEFCYLLLFDLWTSYYLFGSIVSGLHISPPKRGPLWFI
jgi:hypothetical protein